MKTILSALFLSLTASSAFAAPITFEITKLAQKQLDEGSFGPDKCNVFGQIKNGSDQTLQIFMELHPNYEANSMSSMIAPAGNSFGNVDSISALQIAPGVSATEDTGILGAICGEITEITIKPLCKNADFVEIPCPVDVELSPNSVIPIKFESDSQTTGQAAEKPKGPMHGNWEIKGKDGDLIASLALINILNKDIVGGYEMKSALCGLEKMGADCADGSAMGDTIRYASKSGNKVTIRVDISKDSAVTFLWDFETGKGKVVNQRGTMNAPITATLAK